jgi:hypothetical protein
LRSSKKKAGRQKTNEDGFVKSPSVPLRAELRFNFVVAAHPYSAAHSSNFARFAWGALCETIVRVAFDRIINKERVISIFVEKKSLSFPK